MEATKASEHHAINRGCLISETVATSSDDNTGNVELAVQKGYSDNWKWYDNGSAAAYLASEPRSPDERLILVSESLSQRLI
jgi:hypothetical protein